MPADEASHRIRPGQPVFDADGTELGTVRGVDEKGFYVTAADGVEGLSIAHERAGHEFGEGELLWRCSDCGALGPIEDFPAARPDCGAQKEQLYYWTED